MKKLVLLLLVVFLVPAALLFACKNANEQFKYKEIGNGVTITHYTDSSTVKEITIPDTLNGKPVTGIENFGLSDTNYIEKIIISKNVQTIDNIALKNNRNCVEFVVNAENQHFKAVDGVLFTKDMKELIAFPIALAPKNNTYIIPENVETIRPYAFYHAQRINKVIMPDTVKTIGDFAFFRCSGSDNAINYNLAEINFSKALEKIGVDAFSHNGELTSIIIYDKIASIGENAFYNGIKLKDVKICKAEKDINLGAKWYPTDLSKALKDLQITYNYVPK